MPPSLTSYPSRSRTTLDFYLSSKKTGIQSCHNLIHKKCVVATKSRGLDVCNGKWALGILGQASKRRCRPFLVPLSLVPGLLTRNHSKQRHVKVPHPLTIESRICNFSMVHVTHFTNFGVPRDSATKPVPSAASVQTRTENAAFRSRPTAAPAAAPTQSPRLTALVQQRPPSRLLPLPHRALTPP